MIMVTRMSLAVALVFGLIAAPGWADPVTLTGDIVCAKCSLKKADATSCQDVLVVKNEGAPSAEYYVEKNDVAEKFGHVCGGQRSAVVTGEVTEKDGKKWIAPSKMEKAG